MRDEIVEVMVKCRTNIGLAILRIICFVLCALAVLGATAIGGGLLMYAVAVAFGAAGYFAGSYSQVEYEYAYCEKEIDIDAIYSQSRRKHIMTLSLDKMEASVRVNGDHMGEYKNRQCVSRDFTSHDKQNADNVYAIFYDGGLKILIEPGEKLLDVISYFSPRKIFK